MARSLMILVAVMIVAAACGDSADPTTPATTAAPGTSATTVAPTTTVPATTATTVAAATTTTVAPATTTTVVPGEPFDLYVPLPAEGAVLGVVGVQFDDTLNVRSGPGISFDVAVELEATTTGISGTGNGWRLPSGSLWWEIDTAQGTGWANSRFLSRLDGVDDLTSLVVSGLGEIPAAETMLDLGLVVANALAADSWRSGRGDHRRHRPPRRLSWRLPPSHLRPGH